MPMRDLYDWEIQKAAAVYWKHHAMIQQGIPNTPAAVKEFGKRIQDDYYKAGFLVNVDMTPCAIINPSSKGGVMSYPPEVEIIGYVNDPEDKQEFDHDEKRFEVLDSRSKGEKYRGDKERVNRKR